jgi:Cu/Ag efflux protein CusF
MAALSVSCGQQPRADNAASTTPQAATASASPIPWGTIEPPAQVPAPAGTPKAQEPSVVRSYSGVGVVRLINLKEGWLEIDHEEIKGLMAAMQMEWSVKDKAMLKRVSVGDKVNFTVEDNNGSEVITELKKTPDAR